MGDLFIDLRRRSDRTGAFSPEFLRFTPDQRVNDSDDELVRLVSSHIAPDELWSSFRDPHHLLTVALCGHVFPEAATWQRLKSAPPGEGGAAARYIAEQFLLKGPVALQLLNGNFCAVVADARNATVHLVSDRAGVALLYAPLDFPATPVLCTHPDVLAAALGHSDRFDPTSFAEFLRTGRLTFPFTYYAPIRALAPGLVHTFHIPTGAPIHYSSTCFHKPAYAPSSGDTEDELAERLSASIVKAVRSRTDAALGHVTVAASGGLDSRALLASATHRDGISAFTLFDSPNAESATAERVANLCHVPFQPIQRDPEHYGLSARQGVRIAGGYGTFRSNHFLGVRDRLLQDGIQGILTGCYFDYLFKGLALNTAERLPFFQERIQPFAYQHYAPVYNLSPMLDREVDARFQAQFPPPGSTDLKEAQWAQVEMTRCFPLAYEVDAAMRLVPLRVLNWFPPAADSGVLDIQHQLPPFTKLNSAIFIRALAHLLPKEIFDIPNVNNGAPIRCSQPRRALHRYLTILKNRYQSRVTKGLATRGSWPNWDYYFAASPQIRELWNGISSKSSATLESLLGYRPFEDSRRSGPFPVEMKARLLTLGLWLESRVGSVPE